MSLTGRIYPEVQLFLTECFARGEKPTTTNIGRSVFKADYDPDSRKQREALYGAIVRGRDSAFMTWEIYTSGSDFSKDLEMIEFYQQDLIEAEEKDEDFAKFNYDLYKGKFGEATGILKKFMDEYKYIAALWRKKMREYSEQGMNLVVANYGKDSTWSPASWWLWGIRETELFVRSILTTEKQMGRLSKSQHKLLPSGESIEKAIGYTKSTRALIEDGTSWKCRGCGLTNIESANYCSNCGSVKGLI